MNLTASFLGTCLLFSVLLAACATKIELSDADIPADSALGMKLLSNARRIEQNGGDNTWLSGYSIKFLGCHHIQQWNENAEDASDIRVKLKRLVRFRLCPSHTCTSHNEGGCLEDYGDYIIDLQSFMVAYFEATRQSSEYECNHYYNRNCDCDGDKDDDEDFDPETCAYDCYAAAGLENSCTDRNPYQDDAYVLNEFDPEPYMECAEFRMGEYLGDDDANQRKLNQGDDEQVFYVGPYCRHQGGSVMLGMFSDDTCSEFADESHGKETFLTLSGGLELPYSGLPLVTNKCVVCMDQDKQGDDDGQANAGNDLVLDSCQEIYSEAGKCESKLPQDTVYKRNTKACRYVQGIKSVRQDGIPNSSSGANGVITFFIVLLAIACAILGHYIQYLQKITKHKDIVQALMPKPKSKSKRRPRSSR